MATNLRASANSAVGLDAVSGSVTDANLATIIVANLGTTPVGNLPFGGDPSSVVQNSLLLSAPDLQVTFLGVNNNGLVSNAAGGVVAADYQPAAQGLLAVPQNLNALLAGFISTTNQLALSVATTTYGATLANLSYKAPSLADTDPLLIDLTGNGIGVSNWVSNGIYFQTNVTNTGSTASPVWTSDGKAHHTSWANAGTGIVVFDPTGGAVTNITQTLSQFFNGGSNPGHYADGLAALAGLTRAGATSFSAATAAIDPTTGQSYWNEIRIWNDANQNGTVDAGELQTLSAAGISSISLQGSGNLGESLNGSAVTNRASYTTTGGSVGQAAAVNFQTDTTGDLTSTADGGVIINSSAEGTPTSANSFVAKSPSGHSYVLSNGSLTDQTTGTALGGGFTAVLSTNQNDTITVAAGDTGSYWLGGGTGTDTLTGGAGNTVFLINAKTIVHGGTGFNLAQVTDTNAITVDLKTDNLQEVIGGAGDGTFNASGTSWNVFIQGGSGNNIIIGGAAHDALSGGTGNDLIEAGTGGSVIHAGAGNDVIYGGSGTGIDPTSGLPYSDVIYGGAGTDTVVLGTNNTIVYAGTGTMALVGNSNRTVPGLGGQAAFSVLALHGSYADYKLVHNGDGTYTITDSVAGRDGAVTFSNITALDFSDIAQVSLATALGMPVNDQINAGNTSQGSTNASGQFVIAAATLLANDQDYAGKSLAIRELVDDNGNPIARGASGTVNGGTAALSADGTVITFTPVANFSGIYSFRYHVIDSSGANGETVNQIGTTNTAELTATVSINTASQPTDPLFDKEWFLQAADVLPVWKDYTGAGVSVGIFDPSGNVDFSNLDLASNAGNDVKVDGTPGVEQIGTHATLVAGIIGAADDGEGAVGVAPDATISSEAIGTPAGSPSSPINTINLMDWSHYDVVNNSFQLSPAFYNLGLGGGSTSSELSALQNAVTNGRGGLGTIVVVAGGNSRALGQTTNDFVLSNSPDEITVGGINAPSDLGALQISGKPFSDAGYTILVSAPANNVTSDGVTYTNTFGQQFGASTETAAGTSFATPIVAGVVADVLQANPKLTYRDVQQILADSAVKVDPNDTNPFVAGSAAGSGWAYNSASNWNGGGLHYSPDYGFGEVDARAAVRLAETWKTAPGTIFLTVSGSKTNAALSAGTFSDTSQNSIVGLNPSLEFVQVNVDLTNVTLKNLTITLTSPSGSKSVLLNQPNDDPSNASPLSEWKYTFGTQLDRGELYSGGWTLAITDAAGASSTAVLKSWSLTVDGDQAGTSGHGQTYVYTDEFGSISNDPSNASRGTLVGTGNSDTLDAAALTGKATIDLTAGSTDSVIAGRSLSIGSGAKLTTAIGGDGNDTIIANALGDRLVGGRGNNTYVGSGSANTTVDYSAALGAVTLNLVAGSVAGTVSGTASNNGFGGVDTLNNIAAITGTTHGDSIALGSGVSLTLNGSNETVSLGTGDTLNLAAGATATITLNGTGNQLITSASDINQLTLTQSGDDLIVGIAGSATTDTIKNWFAGAADQLSEIGAVDGSSIVLGGGTIMGTGYGLSSGAGIFWQNLSTGQVALWQKGGATSVSRTIFATAPLDWRVVGSGDFNGDGKADLVWQNVATGQIAVWEMNGATPIAQAVVGTAPFGWSVAGVGDFNGDGDADILLRNSTTDQVSIWLMNGTTPTQTPIIATAPAGWYIAGTGDFNGDGKADIVWENNATQQVSLWLINGTTPIQTTIIGTFSAGWQVVGTGDFNGDGKADLLWRNESTGQVGIWEMNGTTPIATTIIGTISNADKVAEVGDFNGDGDADILWQNTATGDLTLWTTNGTSVTSTALVANVATTWQPGPSSTQQSPAVSADFYGAGNSDILWQNSATGDRAIWQFNGTAPSSKTIFATVDPAWSIVGTGDFNGDGKADLVWQNSATGQLGIWLMNGVNPTSEPVIATVSAAWQVVGVDDFYHTGTDDLLWHNSSTGEVGIWEMNGTTPIAQPIFATVADQNWQVAGTGSFGGPGTTDILWRNGATGDTAIWAMNGATPTAETIFANMPTAWQVAGTADFNNDGYDDILWRNTQTGDLALWEMNGTTPISEKTIANVSTAWQVEQVGHLTGAAGADIVWQNSATGQVVLWHLSGTTIVSETIIATASANWNITSGGATATPNSVGQAKVYGVNGSGQVLGSKSDTSAGAVDLGQSVADTNVWLDRVTSSGAVSTVGTDLRIDVLGTQESTTISGWFTPGNQSTFSEIKLGDGSGLILDKQIGALVQAMATFETSYTSSHSGAVFDPTSTANATISDPSVLAAVNQAWHH